MPPLVLENGCGRKKEKERDEAKKRGKTENNKYSIITVIHIIGDNDDVL